jgi:hypothetical protein
MDFPPGSRRQSAMADIAPIRESMGEEEFQDLGPDKLSPTPLL